MEKMQVEDSSHGYIRLSEYEGVAVVVVGVKFYPKAHALRATLSLQPRSPMQRLHPFD